MNVEWLMALAVGVCNSCVAVTAKAAEHTRSRAAPFLVVAFGVAAVTAGLAAVWSAAAGGPAAVWSDWRLWLFGAVMGVLYVAANLVLIAANGCWPPSIVWSAVNAAFVIPIAISAAFLGEPLRPIDAVIFAGVAVMLVGLYDPGRRPDGAAAEPRGVAGSRWLLLGLVVATNGALLILYKLFGVLLPGRSPAALVAILYGVGCVLSAALLAAQRGFGFRGSELLLGLASGAANGLAALAMLGAMRLPAAQAFPVVQGSTLAGGVLACAAVFREQLTPRKLAALAAGLAATVLTVFR